MQVTGTERTAPTVPGLDHLAPGVEADDGTRAWTGRRDGVPVVLHAAATAVRSARARRPYEARFAALQRLGDAAGLVPILDAGFDGSTLWWLEPDDGPVPIEPGPQPLDEVAAIGVDLASGLGRLHAAGLVAGGVPDARVRIAADGRARLALDPRPPVPPAVGEGAVPPHLPPEVLEGRPWTAAADLWSLASSLYARIEGRPPFSAEAARGVADLLLAVTLGNQVPFHRPDVPDALRRTLERALDVDPERRPSAAALGSALVGATGAPLADRLDTIGPEPAGGAAPGPTAPDDQPAVGRPLGSAYLLTEPIGRGAMGRVWRGVRRQDGSPVAVKVLRPELADDPDQVARFLQERVALRSVVDPQVVQVHDLVVEGSILAIVMELVDGADLRRELGAAGTVPPGRVAALVAAAARGLAAVHRAGIVHRDLKPENLLVPAGASAPGGPFVKLTDFGVARVVDGPTLTRPTQLIGTPDYVAPELAAGREPTPASDVYALGVVAYEALAGRRPFVGPSAAAVLQAHLAHDPVVPPGVDPDLWAVVAACLAKDPAARPTAEAVADRLDELRPRLDRQPALPLLPAPELTPVGAPTGGPARLDAPAVPAPAPVDLSAPAVDPEQDRLETAAGRPLSPPAAPPEAPRRRWPLVAGVMAAALLVAVLGWTAANKDRRSDEDAAGDRQRSTTTAAPEPTTGILLPMEVVQRDSKSGRVSVRIPEVGLTERLRTGAQLTLIVHGPGEDPSGPGRTIDIGRAPGTPRRDPDDLALPFDGDDDQVTDILSVEARKGSCLQLLLRYRGAKPTPAELHTAGLPPVPDTADHCLEITK